MADRAVSGRRAPGETVTPLAAPALVLDRRAWVAAGLLATLAAVFVTHVPVLRDHYFFGDDFVPLADIASRGTADYVKDLFLLNDLTPNWRFLTGLYYLMLFETAGLNAFAFLMGSVAAHAATSALIFWLLWRATGRVAAAAFGGTLFGLSAASVPTVGQVTAFNNVLAGTMLMLAIVLVYEAFEPGRRVALWTAGAVVAFTASIAANESAAVLAPAPALAALWRIAEKRSWWQERSELLRLGAVWAAFGMVGATALVGFGVCQCTEASRSEIFSPGGHVVDNLWFFLGRLLYPIGVDPPGDVSTLHLATGLTLFAILIAAGLLGPALARISVVFLLLALVPYVPLVGFTLAPRYVYLATIPFSVLAALFALALFRTARDASPALLPALTAIALGVLALHAWQTWEQNETFAAKTEEWRVFATGLDERFDELPPGSRVYVRGGPLTDAIWQFYVLPSLGTVLWGDAVIESIPDDRRTVCRARAGETIIVDYDGGRFTSAPADSVTIGDPCPIWTEP